MQIGDLKQKKIGILGFGVEGQAIADFLHQRGIAFKVFDKNVEIKSKKFPAENFYLGENYLENIGDCDLLFRSPGIKLSEPGLVTAKNRGVEISSQIKLFFDNCKAKIIGVTGTKGKGTTSKLIYEMLQKAGIKSFLGGNFGVEVLSLLDQAGEDDFVVLELSSFQLQDLEKSPHIAVVLMVVPEHLDYHENVKEYVSAKTAITKYQSKDDFAVINHDFEFSMEIGSAGNAKKYYIQTVPAEQAVKADPFAVYKPEEYLKIKNGIFAEQLHGQLYLVSNGNLQPFMDLKDLPLRGFHNVQNVASAIQVAKILSVADSDILDAVRSYKGLEHRLEFVSESNGIKFYNDSIGTTPESALAAIKSFNENLVLILGGADKKADYQEFANNLAKQKNVHAAVVIGEIAAQLEAALANAGFKGEVISGGKTMASVFKKIKAVAKPGDVVLLAPGTSSFGMFENYKDRGNQFKKFAQKF